MNNYYVEFLGELKNDRNIQQRFGGHYNKWCDIVNNHIEDWNLKFDEQWTGKPIEDYSENIEYQKWMLDHYRALLQEVKMDEDLMMNYKIDDEMQLYGIGKYGEKKGKQISFIIKRG